MRAGSCGTRGQSSACVRHGTSRESRVPRLMPLTFVSGIRIGGSVQGPVAVRTCVADRAAAVTRLTGPSAAFSPRGGQESGPFDSSLAAESVRRVTLRTASPQPDPRRPSPRRGAAWVDYGLDVGTNRAEAVGFSRTNIDFVWRLHAFAKQRQPLRSITASAANPWAERYRQNVSGIGRRASAVSFPAADQFRDSGLRLRGAEHPPGRRRLRGVLSGAWPRPAGPVLSFGPTPWPPQFQGPGP